MFGRIKQGIRYLFPLIDEKTEAEAMKKLSAEEAVLYRKMSKYDRSHSLAVYRDVMKLENKEIAEKLAKAAILHDVGKSDNIGFVERMIYVIIKKGRLSCHAELGYEMLKKAGSDAADIVREHHNKNTDNELVKIFIEIDDKN